jgi:photosystem II stability/assembly factor-like uncharacterized protein
MSLTSHRNVLVLLGCAAALTGATVCATATGAAVPSTHVIVAGTAHQALYSIAFSGSSGVAVGASGQILESTDGGRLWHSAPQSTPAALLGVAVAAHRRIAVGQLGTILVSVGNGWEKVNSGTTSRLFAVAIGSDGSSVAVGAFGTVLRSESADAQWQSIAPKWSEFAEDGVEPHIYGVDVAANGMITIVGEFGLILRSGDAGRTWLRVHSGDASLLAVDLRREDGIGYAVGQSSTVLRTTDHGQSWSTASAGGTSILLGVRSAPDGLVFATGMRDMMVSADDGKTWEHLADREFTGAWYQGVSLEPRGRTALIVGHSGRIMEIGSPLPKL